MEGLNRPFRMALVSDTFYVGNTDGVVAFRFVAGAHCITGPGRKLTSFKPGGHRTRSLLADDVGDAVWRGTGA
jgi:glucose/arabinose dehydrogenase